MKRKKVLFISVGWEQLTLIRLLSARNDIDLYGLHYAGRLAYEEFFISIFQSDYRDLVRIGSYIDSIQPDAIISDEDDYGMFLQAYFTESRGLPGPKIHQAQIACNKFLQRSKAKEVQISIPEFQLCISSSDVESFANRVSYPIILKPIDSRGSIGVSKINSTDEIPGSFFSAIENSPSLLTIAEKFIDGKHFNVDGYCFQNGIGPRSLAVSQNFKEDDGQTTVNRSLVYGEVESELKHKLFALAEVIARGFGFDFGFFHGEFIQCNSSGEIYLTEMANRGGGILISERILPFVSEIPILDIYLKDCLGEDSIISNQIPGNHFARIDFVNLDAGKKYRNFDLNQFENKELELFELVPFLRNGDLIPKIGDGSKRHIMILSNINDPFALESIKAKVKLAAQE